MKILIIGAGQVGGTLAANLASEAFDITLIDSNEASLNELRDKLDIQTVHGWGSHPDVLIRAGADDADMLIAVTSSDEVNMIACQVCYSLFRTPTKIARIRSSSYLAREDFFSQEHMPIDVLINPEQVVTDNIRQLLEHPGALQVLDFADGRVQLVAVKAYYGGPLVGQELSFFKTHLPKVDMRVVAIFRRGQAIVPTGTTVIEADDEVFCIAASEQTDAFCAVTNDDEVNIMSSLLAKKLGARQVITLIGKPAYVDLVQGGEIDIAISPQQATTSSLLSHVRRGDVVKVHSLRRGAAEAMEAIAHGDEKNSKVVGRAIRDIDLPSGTTIGAIVRGKEVIIGHDDVVVQSDDHVIMFLVDKRQVAAVERLFQVGLTFF